MRGLSRALQAATERLDAGSWGGNGASLPPVGMAHNNFAKGWGDTERQAAEQADAAFAAAYPRHAACGCGCRRWESGWASDGTKAWLCAGCHRRYGSPASPGPIARPGYAPTPQAVLPSAAAAREKLEAALLELTQAKAESAAAATAEAAARSAVGAAEQTLEVAAAALTAAQAAAAAATQGALEGGRAAPATDLTKARDYLSRAQDGRAAAQEAQRRIAGRVKDARAGLGRATARARTAAEQVLSAETVPALTVYATKLRDDYLATVSELKALVQAGVTMDDQARALVEAATRPVREWPNAEAAALRAASEIAAKLAALVSGAVSGSAA